MDPVSLLLVASLNMPACVGSERSYQVCRKSTGECEIVCLVPENGRVNIGGKSIKIDPPDKPGGDPGPDDKPDNPKGKALGNPGNAKSVGRAGEKEGRGFDAPSEGGEGTKGRSESKGRDKKEKKDKKDKKGKKNK